MIRKDEDSIGGKKLIDSRKKGKMFLLLHLLFFFYSLFGICSRMASAYPFMSKGFIFYYGIVILSLVVYAILWQQIIRRMPLTTAYANKSVTVLWGILWGRCFFDEKITFSKIVGAIIVVIGIIFVVSGKEDGND